MKDTNQVMLIGKVGFDVESHSDTAASFKLTTMERWKDKTSGEDGPRFEHHRVVCFGELAKMTKAELKKGDRAWVMGSLRSHFWMDKSGVERRAIQISASDIWKHG